MVTNVRPESIRDLDSGGYTPVSALAAEEKINASHVSRIPRLTLLAPDVVKMILDGRLPPEMMKVFPVE